MLSYQGFKRSFLLYLGNQKKISKYSLRKPEKDYRIIIESSVKNIRPFTACAIVKKLSFDDAKIKEIIEIQEKLHSTLGRNRKKAAIGIYPLEKITLPITYKALDPEKIKFIPLEAEREMSGIQILQRHSAGREYAHLLAGKEKFPIFIDANGEILSMPPVINSHKTGKITSNTKEVFVECSGFDLEILKKCLNIVITTLADLGGEIYQMNLEFDKSKKIITPDLTYEKTKLNIENANKLLGIKLNSKQIKSLLEKMGYIVPDTPSTSSNNLLVSIPAWRTDVLHEVDLIEDITIACDYDNFKPQIPESAAMTAGKENPRETIKRKLGEILSGLGLLEISNYHLTTKDSQFTKMGVTEKDYGVKDYEIKVENSKTDFNLLRGNLSHYSLKILSENSDVEYPHKIFEIGKTFRVSKKQSSQITEHEHLSIALSPSNFTELKQIFNSLMGMAGIKEISIKEPESQKHHPNHFIEGRVGNVFYKNELIGFIGEIHPRILKNFHLKMPVALLEINIENILENLKIDFN